MMQIRFALACVVVAFATRTWGQVAGTPAKPNVIIFLSDDVMAYLLSHFARDLTHLMALLDRLDGYALARQRAVTVPLIRQMLADDA